MAAVEKAGIMPYDTIFSGDHRPCFLDLNSLTMFNDKTPPIVPPQYRGLNSYDPRIVKRYIEIITGHIRYHRLEEKTNELFKVAENASWTEENTHTYNQVDKLMTEAMLHAEREVSRKYSDTYHWSPLLSQAVQAKQYWEMRLQQAKGGLVPETRLVKLSTAAGILHDATMKIEDITKATKASRITLREFQRQHIHLRANHLEALAEARVVHRDPSMEAPNRTKQC